MLFRGSDARVRSPASSTLHSQAGQFGMNQSTFLTGTRPFPQIPYTQHTRLPSAIPAYGEGAAHRTFAPPTAIRPRSLDRTDARSGDWGDPTMKVFGNQSPVIYRTQLPTGSNTSFVDRSSGQSIYNAFRPTSPQPAQSWVNSSPLVHSNGQNSYNRSSVIFPSPVSNPSSNQSSPSRSSSVIGLKAKHAHSPSLTTQGPPVIGSVETEFKDISSVVENPGSLPTRGRGLVRNMIPQDSFRRSSRPRRPAPELARLTGGCTSRDASPCKSDQAMNMERHSRPTQNIAESRRVNDTSGESNCKSTVIRGLASNVVIEESNAPAKKPVIPPLALNRVFTTTAASPKPNSVDEPNLRPRQDGVTKEQESAVTTAGDEVSEDVDFGNLFQKLPPNSESLVGIWADRISDEFNGEISACQQSIHKFYKLPEGANRVYQKWVNKAVQLSWIEESEDCHILLKPKLSRRSDQSWSVTHDFTLVNALSTSGLLSAVAFLNLKEIHLWAARHPFLVRVPIPGASFIVPIAESQRRFYGFTIETDNGGDPSTTPQRRYYRYCRMPPGVRGSQRVLIMCYKKHIEPCIPPEHVDNILFRGDEAYVGAQTREQRDNILVEFMEVLLRFGFRVQMSSPRILSNPKTSCCGGVIHDRNMACIRLPEQRVKLIKGLVEDLHTTRCFTSANHLLNILNPLIHMVDENVQEALLELSKAIQCPTNSLLDRSIYLNWDQIAQNIHANVLPFSVE